jgi:hypothetical protein
MLEADRIDALEATPLSETLRGVLTEVLFASGSDLLILPIQDVFGWRDRNVELDVAASVAERPPWLTARGDRGGGSVGGVAAALQTVSGDVTGTCGGADRGTRSG